MEMLRPSSNPNLIGGQHVVAIYADRMAARRHEMILVAQRESKSTLAQRAKCWIKGQKYPPKPNLRITKFTTIFLNISQAEVIFYR